MARMTMVTPPPGVVSTVTRASWAPRRRLDRVDVALNVLGKLADDDCDRRAGLVNH